MQKKDTAASTVKIHYDLLLHYIHKHSATVNDFTRFPIFTKDKMI